MYGINWFGNKLPIKKKEGHVMKSHPATKKSVWLNLQSAIGYNFIICYLKTPMSCKNYHSGAPGGYPMLNKLAGWTI